MNQFQELFDKQKAYFNTDATKTYQWRIDQLDRLKRMLSENKDAFSKAISQDWKTASSEIAFEILAPLATIEYSKAELKGWMEPVEAPLPKSLAATGHKGMIYREPYGVTLVIGPFNGPLVLLFDPAINALTAGNPIILKTSNALPATSALILNLIPQYFEPESVAAVSGNRDAITELLKLPFDFIFFTGSTNVGKVIARAAAENLTPVILELGGQNPAIVDQTANIADAAKKIIWGATAWGGQWCTSPGYAYVHESIAEEFVAEAKKSLLEMFGSDPKSNSDYSKIINAKEVARLASLIDPDKVIAGGDYDEEARYMAPTIVYPVSFSDKIMQDEIFGPILPVLTFKDIKEVTAQVKTMAKPLAGFIFSTNNDTINYLLGSLSFGGGAVNQTNIHLFIESMPFGGVGNSGIGNYYGKYGYDSLTHAKSILHAPADQEISHLFPPFTQEKINALNSWFEF